jgi:hypothetical protein
MISRPTFEQQAKSTLKLMIREKHAIIYLLPERGYTADFAATVRELMAGITPVDLSSAVDRHLLLSQSQSRSDSRGEGIPSRSRRKLINPWTGACF